MQLQTGNLFTTDGERVKMNKSTASSPGSV